MSHLSRIAVNLITGDAAVALDSRSLVAMPGADKDEFDFADAAVDFFLKRQRECGLQRSWSIAELRLTEDDFGRLASLAKRLDAPRVRRWIGDPWTRALLHNDDRPSRQACLGFFLLAFAAEVARRDAVERTLWPHVRRDRSGVPRFGSEVDRELFDAGGQPTLAFKETLEAAAREFGLRHALDQTDTQRFYRTVFLQFGFTIRDAQKHLGPWLVGVQRPVTVADLLAEQGPRYSKSFAATWKILRLSRSRNLRPEMVVRRLEEDPWVLPGWVAELPELAARHPELRDAVDGPSPLEAEEAEVGEILGEPVLRWALSDGPRFVCPLKNLDTAGLAALEYDLRAGGKRLARITRNGDGAYEAPAEPVTLPTFAPEVVVELVARDGKADEVAATRALTCFDPEEDVAVFEARSGRHLKAGERLNPTADYFLLFPPDLTLEPARGNYRLVASGRYRVEYLSKGDISSARLRLGEEIVWTPRVDGTAAPTVPSWAKQVELRVDGSPDGLVAVGGSFRLRIDHPKDVEIVYARCRMAPIEVVPKSPGKSLAGPVTFSADMPAGALKWTIGLRRDGESARVTRTLEIKPFGAAILRGHVWATSASGSRLSADEARSSPIRVFPPETWDRQKVARGDWAFMEGDTRVDGLGVKPQTLKNLAGLGARLTIRRGPLNALKDRPPFGDAETIDAVVLAGEVIDRGKVREVHLRDASNGDPGARGAILECEDQVEIDGDHEVIWWDRDGRIHRLRPSAWEDGGDPRHDWWDLHLPPLATRPRAVAASYRGRRLGAWWDADWHVGLEALGDEDPAGVAARLRWFRLPILAPSALPAVRRFATAHAAAVLPLWVPSADPPELYHWDSGHAGWMAAVREVFSDWRPTPEQAETIAESWEIGDRREGDDPLPEVARALALLNICPLVMGRFLRAWVASARDKGSRCEHIRAVVRSVREAVVQNSRVNGSSGTSQTPNEREVLGELLKKACEGLGSKREPKDDRFIEELIKSAVDSLEPRRVVGEFDQRPNVTVAVVLLKSFRDLLALRVLGRMIDDIIPPDDGRRRP